jgi:glycogen debranching enzyme
LKTGIPCHPELLPEVICDQHPEWVALNRLAWRMGFNNVEHPGKNGWKPQLTCMPGIGILWQWDSCFMTFFARYSNGQLPGMNNLDNLYRLQRRDGYQSMAYRIATEKPAYGERINPPLFAWAEWEYFQVTGDDSRFKRVLPRLVRYFDWLKQNRRRESGLYWFEDTGSTGMDNSPRSGYPAKDEAGSDICFIDLACQQALAAQCVAQIARHLGQARVAERFASEHKDLVRLINEQHWCEKDGIYYDLFSRGRCPELRHNYLNHKTLASFWPMISGIASKSQVRRLVEHLRNPEEFWRPHPLPTLSWDDPNYDPEGGYWLGGVWAPTNYMVARGLQRFGYQDLAREIAVRHVAAMCSVAKNRKYGGIWECYSPEFMRPAAREGAKLVRPDFVGWTGLGPIAMLIEQIFGFDFDAKANRIHWMIVTPGRHGVRNLRFNGQHVSMVCEAASRGCRRVTIETQKPLRLTLEAPDRAVKLLKLRAGRHVVLVHL